MVHYLSNLQRQSFVRTKVALVLRLIDSFTGQKPIDRNLSLVVYDVKKQPIKKADGFYVLIDIEPGEYRVSIQSPNYIEETTLVTINEQTDQDEIFNIILKPSPTYLNQTGQAGIRFKLDNKSNDHLDEVHVTAAIKDLTCTVAKLAQDYPGKSSNKVNIVKNKPLFVGDYLQITQKSQNNYEYCFVSELFESEQCVIFSDPLQNEYKRGSSFLPVIKTTVNKQGEALVLFRNYQVQSFEVTLEVSCHHLHIERELQIQAGSLIDLGTILL